MKKPLGLMAATSAIAATYFVGFRPWQLRWGATRDELSRSMPGDDIVQRPSFDATRGVTINAAPEAIFPWIRQMGLSRAGWYSYDVLDNLARPSARHILPELQASYAGQLIPMSPDGKFGVFVKEFVENSWMLWWDQKDTTSWAWGLYPEDEQRTRLVTRIRVHYNWLSWEAPFNLLIELGDFWMMHKCLLGIKKRAESA